MNSRPATNGLPADAHSDTGPTPEQSSARTDDRAPGYPVFLDLGKLSLLVVGFGAVGRRKVEMALPCRPLSVLVLDTRDPDAEGEALLSRGRDLGLDVRFERRSFTETDLDSADLVFACAGDHDLNARVADACARHRVLCNCTDNPGSGSFHVPSVVRAPHVALALSTERSSPALARVWKRELEDWLDAKEPMVVLMGDLRPLVLAAGLPQPENAALFRALAQSPDIRKALESRETDSLVLALEALLPRAVLDRGRERVHQAVAHALNLPRTCP